MKGFGHHVYPIYLVILALICKLIIGPGLQNQVQSLNEPFPSLINVDAIAGVLADHGAPAGAQNYSSLRDMIEGSEFFGQAHRMVQGH